MGPKKRGVDLNNRKVGSLHQIKISTGVCLSLKYFMPMSSWCSPGAAHGLWWEKISKDPALAFCLLHSLPQNHQWAVYSGHHVIITSLLKQLHIMVWSYLPKGNSELYHHHPYVRVSILPHWGYFSAVVKHDFRWKKNEIPLKQFFEYHFCA